MTFRQFGPGDAEFCFRVRSAAFIIKFYGELSSQEVAAAVNCYMPSDYDKMAEEQKVFLCEENGQRLGFFILKRHDHSTAEMPLLYFDLKHLNKGLGCITMKYAEEWIKTNWKEVTALLVDTVIPKYNGGFYKKMGFTFNGHVSFEFNGLKVKAVRFSKQLDAN